MLPTKSLACLEKLILNPPFKTNLTIGGAINHTVNRPFIYTYSLLNWDNNPEEESNTWRVYGKFTQRFGAQEGDEESASTIKNAFTPFLRTTPEIALKDETLTTEISSLDMVMSESLKPIKTNSSSLEKIQLADELALFTAPTSIPYLLSMAPILPTLI